MRSPAEIAHRAWREAANLRLWLSPPRITVDVAAPLPGLPAPRNIAAALKGSPFCGKLEQIAESVLDGRYQLLGLTLQLGRVPKWRADPAHGVETGLSYFRRIRYLDFSRVGDHKFIWELNRHQHLVLLAQAFVASGREKYCDELLRQWESWVEQNPFQCGINWASALEVGIRALSWIWIYHLTGERMTASQRRRFLKELYRHGRHLEVNLSLYFSPNTHLLGEAVALHALGILFPSFPRAPRWVELGARIVRTELKRQAQEDGAHFEQSTYYHVYALDLFLLHYILSRRPERFRPTLERMAEYLVAMMGPQRRLPAIGDDDGGRIFFPYGLRDEFGRATLATCARLFSRPEWAGDDDDDLQQALWWVGPIEQREKKNKRAPKTQMFAASGSVVWQCGDLWVAINAGGFGALRAGHSHSHVLSVVARLKQEDLLIDPGTFTYTADPRLRGWFRSSAAHNTVRVNGLDQARQDGPFAWAGKPAVTIESLPAASQPIPCEPRLAACCRYSGADVRHRRYFGLTRQDTLFIVDEIRGAQRLACEQFWRPGEEVVRLSARAFRIGKQAQLVVTQGARLEKGGEHGWRSRVYGAKEPAPVIVATTEGEGLVFLGAALTAAGGAQALELAMVIERRRVGLRLNGDVFREVWFDIIGN
ncbi:MAG TPA: alginate lyase family protein [Bryobacteraceae bacterium]|nr:alginate lyase family protein [Bryobacteraceae bacterium]